MQKESKELAHCRLCLGMAQSIIIYGYPQNPHIKQPIPILND